jgi:hypothetical protein
MARRVVTTRVSTCYEVFKTIVVKGHLSSSMCDDLVALHHDDGWTIESIKQYVNHLHRRCFIYSHYLREDVLPWRSQAVWVLAAGCHS